MKIEINKDLYETEKELSAVNRQTFADFKLPVVNLIGSPGCGKTTLLEATLAFMRGQGKRIGIIEGDVQTSIDSDRLAGFGMPVSLVNTNGGCHLSSEDIRRAAHTLPLDTLDLLIIENVGNLVCPAAFDLGESMKIAVLSAPEGEEKPLKYPALFANAGCAIITKIEIAQICRFDLDKAMENIRSVNPDVKIIPLSVFEGTNMDEYFSFMLGIV